MFQLQRTYPLIRSTRWFKHDMLLRFLDRVHSIGRCIETQLPSWYIPSFSRDINRLIAFHFISPELGNYAGSVLGLTRFLTIVLTYEKTLLDGSNTSAPHGAIGTTTGFTTFQFRVQDSRTTPNNSLYNSRQGYSQCYAPCLMSFVPRKAFMNHSSRTAMTFVNAQNQHDHSKYIPNSLPG